jgi:DUF1680 family protein
LPHGRHRGRAWQRAEPVFSVRSRQPPPHRARGLPDSCGALVGRRRDRRVLAAQAGHQPPHELVHDPDPALNRQLDAIIALIAAAQEPDGYLMPARTIDPKQPAPGLGPERWVHLNGSHELYNAGHLYEAAVAHHQATGARTLLDVAIRNAALVASVFGPAGRRAAPGHQEIELALFRLAEVTRDARYADLARFFLDQRGRSHDTEPYPDPGPFAMYNGLDYKQDHAPVVAQDRAVGHAVRATYMYAAMADVAAVFREPGYAAAVDRLWQDVVSKRLYLTGSVGSRSGVEAFGDDYELPNAGAYSETCAAIGFGQWNHRMFRLHGDAKYLDALEQVLYNGLLSGVSLSGDRFFYQNPLASDGTRERSAYFEVACCPANLARTLAQIPSFVYAQRDDVLYVGLLVGSETTVEVAETRVHVVQRTRYPWDGTVTIRVDPARPADFAVHVRIPGWARHEPVARDLYRFGDRQEDRPTLAVNGRAAALDLDKGFARLRRTWQRGDVVELRLPMPVRLVMSHDGIVENRGRVAIQRGPLVYCAEGPDNGGQVGALTVARDITLGHTFRPDLLGGVVVVTGRASGERRDDARPDVVAIPYYAWANRGKSEMAVWLPLSQRAPD